MIRLSNETVTLSLGRYAAVEYGLLHMGHHFRRPGMRSLKNFGPSATDMIRADHTRVMALFHRYKASASATRKQALFAMIRAALLAHARIEDEIFYPAMRAAGSTLLDELEPEHEEMRSMIAQLSGMQPDDPQYDQTFMEMMRAVIHHVADEETMLLTHAETVLGDRLGALGAQMARRRVQMMAPRAAPASGWMVAAGALLAGLYLVRRRA
jgi:hypothetical protein